MPYYTSSESVSSEGEDYFSVSSQEDHVTEENSKSPDWGPNRYVYENSSSVDSPVSTPSETPIQSPIKSESSSDSQELINRTRAIYWREKVKKDKKYLEDLSDEEKEAVLKCKISTDLLQKIKSKTYSDTDTKRAHIWQKKIERDVSILERLNEEMLLEYQTNGLTVDVMDSLVSSSVIKSKSINSYWSAKLQEYPEVAEILTDSEKEDLIKNGSKAECYKKGSFKKVGEINNRRARVWKRKIDNDESILNRLNDEMLSEYNSRGLTDEVMDALVCTNVNTVKSKSKSSYWSNKLRLYPEVSEMLSEEEIKDLLENGSKAGCYLTCSFKIKELQKDKK